MMNHEWIRSCLELPPGAWPPDHYTLLGLEHGEADSRRIEQRVQERMEKLRLYQLTHTEQATEAMNRLAQALVCLSDPAARQAYDAHLSSRQLGRARRPSDSRPYGRNRQSLAAKPRLASPAYPHWLLLAWLLWLVIGAAGFVALALNHSAIEESWRGDNGTVKTGQERQSKLLPSPPRTTP